MRMASAACVLVMILWPALAPGADSTVRAGAKAVATAELTLRDAPPSGTFDNGGAAIGVIRKGDRVVVRDVRVVKNLFAAYQWCLVDLPELKRSGWVYSGTLGGETYLKPLGGK